MSESNGYFTGNCDIMALALHQLTGLPLGFISGKVMDDMEESGFFYEHAHAVVIVDRENEKWMDAGGVSTGIPDNCYFSNTVKEILIVEATEEEVRQAFTSMDISEESIEEAKVFAIENVFGGVKPDLPSKMRM